MSVNESGKLSPEGEVVLSLGDYCSKQGVSYESLPCKAAYTDVVRTVMDSLAKLLAEKDGFLVHPEVYEHEEILFESFKGVFSLIRENFSEQVDRVVRADCKLSTSGETFTKVFLKLRSDFEDPKSLGEALENAVPEIEVEYYAGNFVLGIMGRRFSVLYLRTIGEDKYLEVGQNEYTCLATIAFLSISTENHRPFYEALAHFVAKSIPFDTGEINLAGYDEVVERCDRILSCDDPKLMKRHILLCGPPGCGKSMIAKQLVKNHPEYLRCCLSQAAAEWIPYISMLSKVARNCSRRMLLVIDEIDELGLTRDVNRDAVYNLLRMMDGVDNQQNLTIVATTNRRDDLDEALLRPGRFYPVFTVDFPDRRQQREILGYYVGKYGVDVDVDLVLENAKGEFTGADIRAAVEECIINNVPITGGNLVSNLSEIKTYREKTRLTAVESGKDNHFIT